jgi:hypothetical protein
VAASILPRASFAATAGFEEIKQRGYLLYGFNGERPYNYTDPEGNLIRLRDRDCSHGRQNIASRRSRGGDELRLVYPAILPAGSTPPAYLREARTVQRIISRGRT